MENNSHFFGFSRGKFLVVLLSVAFLVAGWLAFRFGIFSFLPSRYHLASLHNAVVQHSADYYTRGWRQASIGGGGFTLETRVAPPGFLGYDDQKRVYLVNDMNGLVRSSVLNASTGEVLKWEHLWNPHPNSGLIAPTRYMTSVAFTNAFKNANESRVVVGSRDGIYLWNESTQSWSVPSILPDRTFFQTKFDLVMNYSDGRYPWVSVIREVPEQNRYLLAGIGDTRFSDATQKRRFGLGAVYRSMDGGDTWDVVPITHAQKEEVVFDFKFFYDGGTYHTFLITDQAVYYSSDVFSSAFPKFVVLSGNLPVNSSDSSRELAELRGIEILNSLSVQDGPDLGLPQDRIMLFASVFSDSGAIGGVYFASTTISTIARDPALIFWQRVKADTQTAYKRSWEITKKPGSFIDNFQLYISKVGMPFLGVIDSKDMRFVSIVDGISRVGDLAYEPDARRSGFGNIEVLPADFHSFKNPTVFGAWSFGPIYAFGNNDLYSSKRKYYQMFTTLHHEERGSTFYEGRGFDEFGFKGFIPAFDPWDEERILLGAVDNGFAFTSDGGSTWAVNHPQPIDVWYESYGTTLKEVRQAVFHPFSPGCVIASVGPSKYKGDVVENQGQLLVNLQGGFGGVSAWSPFAGGASELNGLPNAEVTALVFDPRPSHKGEVGLFAAVLGRGIYYAEITHSCAFRKGTTFIKITHDLLSQKISDVPGVHHYYSAMIFDPSDSDRLYVARDYPAGGVFELKLGFNAINGERVKPYRTPFIVSVREIIRGAVNPLGEERCPLDRDNNIYNASQVFSIAANNEYVFAGVGYGISEDRTSKSKMCALSSASSSTNYYGGIVRWKKNDSALDVQKNDWIVGGFDRISSPPVSVFSIGGIAVNPAYPSDVVAITTGATYPRRRISDNLFAGEDDPGVAGLWISNNGGNSFSFSSWAFPFPQAYSLTFSPSGKKLVVPTFGRGVWMWEVPR